MLAQRHIGLILPLGNPQRVESLADLARPGLRFVNRQAGSGTRVWLDAMLGRSGISPESILGYDNEQMTHLAVAQAVAQGQADAGIGLEAAALSYGLDFRQLTLERYDLIIPQNSLRLPQVQALVDILAKPEIRVSIQAMGGYDTASTGSILWIG